MILDEIGWNEYPYEIQQIAKQLNVPSKGEEAPTDSIMTKGVVCNHKTGKLCAHRLIWILNNIDTLVCGEHVAPFHFTETDEA